ncbi:MAG: hypothetical protein K1Y36_29620 [Blastocatellia bacterium]|nr:hypothetical protein [Blastocatellia bacterium]
MDSYELVKYLEQFQRQITVHVGNLVYRVEEVAPAGGGLRIFCEPIPFEISEPPPVEAEPKGPGRPRTYPTPEEAKKAKRVQQRLWQREYKARQPKSGKPRGRPRKSRCLVCGMADVPLVEDQGGMVCEICLKKAKP